MSRISNVAQVQPVAPVMTNQSPRPKPPTAGNTSQDSVQIANGPEQTALQELSWTPAQVLMEAGRGNRDAQQLLAEEEARSLSLGQGTPTNP